MCCLALSELVKTWKSWVIQTFCLFMIDVIARSTSQIQSSRSQNARDGARIGMKCGKPSAETMWECPMWTPVVDLQEHSMGNLLLRNSLDQYFFQNYERGQDSCKICASDSQYRLRTRSAKIHSKSWFSGPYRGQSAAMEFTSKVGVPKFWSWPEIVWNMSF